MSNPLTKSTESKKNKQDLYCVDNKHLQHTRECTLAAGLEIDFMISQQRRRPLDVLFCLYLR